LLFLAGEGLLTAWVYWLLKPESLWAWPLVIVTRSVPCSGLWLLAGTSAAGLFISLFSLVYPERDGVAKALATVGLIAHSGVLAVVAYSIVRPH
jgi:hypothetical protein